MNSNLKACTCIVLTVAGLFLVGFGKNAYPPNRLLTVPGTLLIVASLALICMWTRSIFWIRCPHCGKESEQTFGARKFCPYCGNPFIGSEKEPPPAEK